ncbi:MAG: YHS domain-containing protein [Fidelibacterota bacterium]
MKRDPVCGMQIKKKKAAGTSEYGGKIYYFCSSHCQSTFAREPAKYAQKGDEGPETHHCH